MPDGVIIIVIFALPILVALIYLDLRRLIMVSKADLETQIDDLGTAITNGLAGLGTIIQNETQQVLDAIAAGQDLTTVSAKVTGIQTAFATGLATVQSEIENIVTPPTA